MRIPLRHFDILMSQKLRYLVEVYSCLGKPCGKGMSEVMESEILYLGLNF